MISVKLSHRTILEQKSKAVMFIVFYGQSNQRKVTGQVLQQFANLSPVVIK